MMIREIPRPRQGLCYSDEGPRTTCGSSNLDGQSLSSIELFATAWWTL